jgi:DNA-binding PadR family transcriptional regulator
VADDENEALGTRDHRTLARFRRELRAFLHFSEEAGLVVSHADPDDGRRRLIAVTPAGEEILERLSALHRRELRRFRDEMGALLGELD